MLKRFASAFSIVALALMPLSASPSLAQGWQDVGTDASGNQTNNNSPAVRKEFNFYQQQQPGGTGPSTWGTAGRGKTWQGTQSNGAVGGGNNFGPQLAGAAGGLGTIPGMSGASQGGPILGSYFAPQNLALQVEHHSPIGGSLPKTTLDSFVAQSGYNDHIYGDEGTDGPPPYSSFDTIGSGGVQATTGHQSDCPSAWY